MIKDRSDTLPRSLPPRGLSRTVAAAYIGVSPALFDAMVKDGRMPKPKTINSRVVWDIRKVDRAFDELPGGDVDDTESWDFGKDTSTPEERARYELTPWERKLLLGLYNRFAPTSPRSLEGAGRDTRLRLASRGLIIDDGKMLTITDAGTELAMMKLGIPIDAR